MTRKEQKEAGKMQILRAALDLFVEWGCYRTKCLYYESQSGQASRKWDL